SHERVWAFSRNRKLQRTVACMEAECGQNNRKMAR
ncbi:hypothetical protein C8D77_113151, partial [Mesorhizobium loti]